MKLVAALFASALIAVSAGVAGAETIQLTSYGTGAAPAGAGNSAMVYEAYGPLTFDNNGNVTGVSSLTAPSSSTTYNLSTGISPWTAALGNSSWVAQNVNDTPGGGHVETNDSAFVFYTTFSDSNGALSSGSLTLMADDTAAVFLNNNEILAQTSTATGGTCDSNAPNCTVPYTFALPTADFLTGNNVLTIAVLQEHGSAEGLDFVGSVNVTPEPDSLLLLGTGLAMLAGFAYSRRVQA